MVLSSLKETIPYKKTIHAIEDEKRFYTNGSCPRINLEPAGFDWENAKPGSDYQENRIDENISDVKKIIDLCKKYNIKLIIFTNPLHAITYQEAVKNGYLDFLFKLSEITEYYNFSGINNITINNTYFNETSHYKFEVGDMIIDAIFNNILDEELLGQGFGCHVTRNNRDMFLEILDNQRER
jgi:sugar phosphate isomerase/epimerase